MVISSDQRVCRESNYVARCRTLRAVGECSYLGGSIRGRGSRCSRTRSLRSVSARDGIAEGRRRQRRWSPNRKCFNNRAAPPPPAAARVSIQLNTRGVRLQPCRQATIGHVGDGESTCSDAPRSSSFASAIFAKPRRCCRRCRQASASVPRRPRFARSSVLPAVVPRSKCAACVFARNARTRSLPRTCGESTCCGRIAAPLEPDRGGTRRGLAPPRRATRPPFRRARARCPGAGDARVSGSTAWMAMAEGICQKVWGA
jgi:hypothetical protein